ncbi:2-aminoadipate transaminase [Thermosporothrix hazakensis]|uniref:2-aminoadipate transaminase n=1 Tax=Thermosporothrix hazakensis TaxID=644383 RepID=A0A326U7K5_THEHA|nr:PLP-dependent aminotransferase family protein [Thermosporothrix hazakensis]PZW31159.1 2-aminoadipate transaminase [Thermosporothrix hazakensis]GCE50929.1 aminotransferase [Thermosporothrix hazakensis]
MHTRDQRFARRTERMQGSAIRELLKVTEIPGTISLAGGLPASDIFPVQQVAEATQRILKNNPAQALQYGTTEGYTPLRELIIERMRQKGIHATVDNILIVSGSQQGLDLIAKILVDPNDRLLVEEPTYMGALQAFNPYEPRYIAVRSDDQGIVTEELEAALQQGPKCLYALPNFQNPSGVTYTLERRQQLVELAGRYNVTILEDDPYSELRFEGEHLPSLLALEQQRVQQPPERPYAGNVIQFNTFSKILTPGLRLGWVVAPAEVIRMLVLAKQGTDLHTSTFNQLVAYELMRDGFLESHIPLIRETYRQRCNAMLDALERYFPEGVRWTRPQGGMFLWVTLPEHIDAAQLLSRALEYKIAFVPGAAFHPCGGGQNTMRLSFSSSSPEQIDEGIKRLGSLLKDTL